MFSNRFTRAAIAIAALCSFSFAVHAQAYPDKPIKIVVGQAAGGGMDILARMVGERVGSSLGQPVVVENRSGAGGMIGTEYVAKSPADGYTLLLGPIGNMVFTPILMPKMKVSVQKDFTPVSMLATFPLVLLVNANLPVKSVPELIKYLRDNPKKANFGGSGPAFQFASELFKIKTKTPGEFIQYRSMGETITAIASGDLAMALVDTGPATTGLSGGRVKALAVTSPQRLPSLPQVPTMAEMGLPDLEIDYWAGIFAPTGTPAAIVKKLETEINQALRQPQVIERMEGIHVTPAGSNGAELARVLDSDLKKWKGVADTAHIQPIEQ
jgi:tripartite-type tricarboxylate transporter receptor subunit TctC